MRKFTSNNKEINKITFNGIKYFFILDEKGVGIRRKDDKVPDPEEIAAVTEYLFNEGWANKEDYDDEEDIY